jgi:hypothetical protein
MQYQNTPTPQERAEIDAALAEMVNDPDYQTEVLKIEAEFALAQWEALEIEEPLPQPHDNGWATMYTHLWKSWRPCLRSPNPLKKGALEFKVPLFKGDLGGSKASNGIIDTCAYTGG